MRRGGRTSTDGDNQFAAGIDTAPLTTISDVVQRCRPMMGPWNRPYRKRKAARGIVNLRFRAAVHWRRTTLVTARNAGEFAVPALTPRSACERGAI
jgi:hypothetical protein